MGDLLIAILLALKTLFPQEAGMSAADYEAKRLEIAHYVLDNNLYRVEDGGVLIDPDVTH